MANYSVDIAVALKGAEKLTNFNKTVKNTGLNIKDLTHQLKTAAKDNDLLIRSFNNLNKVLSTAKANFNSVASGTKLQKVAALELIAAERKLNKEYETRNNLLNNLANINKRISPTEKAIRRNERLRSRRPIQPLNPTTTGSSFLAFSRSVTGASQYSSPLEIAAPRSSIVPGQSLFGQSVDVEGRSLQIQREEFELQSKLGQMEIRSLRNKRKDLTFEELITRNIERQTKLEKNNQVMLSESSRRRRQRILDNPFNKMKQGLRGRSPTARARRGQAASNALIGGAFPLLFGQGLGASVGGFTGGGAGGLMGGQFGFALSLVGTAIGSSLDRMIGSLKEFGNALNTTEDALKMMTDRNLFSSKAIQKQAESLKRQGKQAELTELITRDLSNSLGALSLDGVQKFSSEMEELTRQFGLLTTQFQLLAAGPLGRIIEMINSGLGRQVLESRISNQLRALEKADPQKFKQFLESNQRSRDEAGQGRFEKVMNMLTNNPIAAFDTNIGPGNFQFGGRSIESLQNITSTLDPILKGLGITSGGLGKNDMDKAMALLETEAGNLRAKNESLRSSFGIESAIAVLKEKYAGLDKEILDNLEIKARKQLETNERLEIENHQLQMTLDLYKNIATSIENGIVTAIEGAIEGTKTLGDVARSVFSEIQRSLIRFGVNSLLSSIPGFGRFFRANGGPVSSGKSYIVGERGPELFTPNAGGRITSNENLNAGSTNISVNVDASGSSVEGDEQKGRELGQMLSAAIQSELIKQRRPGGLLT